MDAFKKGWYSELGPMWPGISQSLEIEAVLHEEKSAFQQIGVYQTKTFGRLLTLDGVFQLTERDECGYHETLAHVALYAHPHPRRVLIIGGGDGGVVREMVKHACIEHIDLCDIDERVTAVSRAYFPTICSGLSDPRLTLHFADGAAFVRNVTPENRYDIIVTDSSDPVGPAEVLYCEEYYRSLLGALNEGGIVCSQAESMWLHGPVITNLVQACHRAGFGVTEYATIMIPTYPGGSIGALFCRKTGTSKKPARPITEEEASKMRYYNPALHAAAFVHPTFLNKLLEDAQK